MFSGITITCFAASYAVTFGLEITRLFFRAPVRLLVMIAFAIAGLLAHTLYLVVEAQRGLAAGIPLSSLYHWCLMVAWVLAAMYLGLTLRRPQTAVGLFMLPLVLLVLAGAAVLPVEPFAREQAITYWGILHGVALLLGTVVVTLGFVAGLMYLAQSYRLKHKLPPRRGLQLPSLEWLQRINRRALYVSSCLLAAGLLAGWILNLIKHARDADAMPWSDPVVWTSAVLLVWLVASSMFEYLYKPAREGRKVAYLTLASFVFLGLVLGIVLFGPSEHTSSKPQTVGRFEDLQRQAEEGDETTDDRL